MTGAFSHQKPARPKQANTREKNSAKHSLTSRIHHITLATLVHDLGYDGILPELMYKQRDFRIEFESSAVPPPFPMPPMPLTSTPFTTVAEPGMVLEGAFLLEGSMVMW
jgi:hypothetical protein